MPFYSPNEIWWKDTEGQPITYWGNQGADGEKTYHCYVLTAWRAGGAFERGLVTETRTGPADRGWASMQAILLKYFDESGPRRFSWQLDSGGET